MRRRYATGYSLDDIAHELGCQSETIRYHLLRAGVQLRPRGCHSAIARAKQTAERHHNWKGGRSSAHGYWRARAIDHPHADPSGYVSEHRLLMERHLLAHDPQHPALSDGYLRRDWVVHHKNGNKGDNRIENLEPLPRGKHHSWMHYHEENARLRALLAEHGIALPS